MKVARVDTSPNPLATIRSRSHDLSPAERTVAEFTLSHPEALVSLSVTDLAARVHVSDATITRFCQRMGYRGYQQFKIFLARDIGQDTPQIYPELEPGDSATTVLQKTTHLSVQALQDTQSTLKGAELERASHALRKAHTVAIFGVGGSGGIALVAQQRLLRLRVPAFVSVDTHVLGWVSQRLRPHDVAFGITHSGRTPEIVSALQIAQEHGATTVTLTNHAETPVTHVSDIVLLTGAAETPLASEAGTSRIVQLAAIDALCARLLLLNRRPKYRRNKVISET